MSEDQNVDDTAVHEQFSKIADLARKATEDHIARLDAALMAPLVDPYNRSFGVLCGVVAAVVTSFVGMSDNAGDDIKVQTDGLNTLAQQMGTVFVDIQQRKGLLNATDGVTKQ